MNNSFLMETRLYELKFVLNTLSYLALERDDKRLVILEVGSGAGWQAKVLSEEGYVVEGIDIAGSYYSEERVWPVTSYDGEHIPFDDNYFDVVFSSNVLEHIPDVEKFQYEIQRVLKPHGTAIHILPSGTWAFWRIVARYLSICKVVLKTLYCRVFPGAKENIYNAAETQALAQTVKRSKLKALQNALFPSRHGQTGTTLSEIHYFSKYRWIALFRRNGWTIKRYTPTRLFYTGAMILGSALSLQARSLFSYLFGSSCHIFVLTKIPRTEREER